MANLISNLIKKFEFEPNFNLVELELEPVPCDIAWWERQLPALEQFSYVGMDFRGDPDLVLPPRGAWGELGK